MQLLPLWTVCISTNGGNCAGICLSITAFSASVPIFVVRIGGGHQDGTSTKNKLLMDPAGHEASADNPGTSAKGSRTTLWDEGDTR